MISFKCDCGKRYEVSDKYAGKRGRCPQCKEVVVIPLGNQTTQNPNKAVSKLEAEICSNCYNTIKEGEPRTIIAGKVHCLKCKELLAKRQASKNNLQPPKSQTLSLKAKTTDCSFCGEKILAIAKKCKHCGEFLESGDDKSASSMHSRIKSDGVIEYKGSLNDAINKMHAVMLERGGEIVFKNTEKKIIEAKWKYGLTTGIRVIAEFNQQCSSFVGILVKAKIYGSAVVPPVAVQKADLIKKEFVVAPVELFCDADVGLVSKESFSQKYIGIKPSFFYTVIIFLVCIFLIPLLVIIYESTVTVPKEKREASARKIQENIRIEEEEKIAAKANFIASFPKFNISWERMPKGFEGYDLSEVYRALGKIGVSKEKFETEAEYKARAKKAFPFYIEEVNVASDSLMPIVNEAGHGYDVEKQVYEIYTSWSGVEESTWKFGEFAFNDGIYIKSSSEFPSIPVLELKVPRSIAKQIDDKIQFKNLYVIRPFYQINTWDAAYTFSYYPTFYSKLMGRRVEKPNANYCIYANIIEVWIYRDDTGEVLKKYRRTK